MLAHVLALSLMTSLPSPSTVVQEGNNQVQTVLTGGQPTVEKLATKVEQFVDFAELAKRALGKEWSKLSKQQQQEFSSTMKGLLRASYAQRALGQGNADVEYRDEKITGNEASVATAIQVKNEKFPVVYKLYKTGSGWRIYDVVTDDVSLVDTYRDQFRKLISTKGYDGLLLALKSKKDQLEKNSN